jgi:hypothetical protein
VFSKGWFASLLLPLSTVSGLLEQPLKLGPWGKHMIRYAPGSGAIILNNLGNQLCGLLANQALNDKAANRVDRTSAG